MIKRVIIITTVLTSIGFCHQILASDQQNVVQKVVQKIAEQNIDAAIEKANYCETTDDCTIVSFSCPFGCGSYINKKEEKFLQEKVDKYFLSYGERCIYKCARPAESVCVNQRCVPAVCEPDKLNKQFQCECPKGTKYVDYPKGDFKCLTEKEK